MYKQFLLIANTLRLKCCGVFFCGMMMAGCGSEYTPKPRGYFRIDFPEKQYQRYQSGECPFSFDYPVYARVFADTGERAEACWLNVDYLPFRGRLHLSYKPLGKDLRKYTEDARSLAYKHSVKADAINERLIHTEDGSGGMLYEIEGNAASSIQFFVTDSSRHFLRGALYFPVAPRSDSLAPVVKFIAADIQRMIAGFRWGNYSTTIPSSAK